MNKLRAFSENRALKGRKSAPKGRWALLLAAVAVFGSGLWSCQDQDLDAVRLRQSVGGQTTTLLTTLVSRQIDVDTITVFDTLVAEPDTVVFADTIFLTTGNILLFDTAVVIDTVFTPLFDSLAFDTTEFRANELFTSDLENTLPALLEETGLDGQSGAKVRVTRLALRLLRPSGGDFSLMDSVRTYAVTAAGEIEVGFFTDSLENPSSSLELDLTGNAVNSLIDSDAALRFRVEMATNGVTLEDSLTLFIDADFLIEGGI